jgi:hypothetical protein
MTDEKGVSHHQALFPSSMVCPREVNRTGLASDSAPLRSDRPCGRLLHALLASREVLLQPVETPDSVAALL